MYGSGFLRPNVGMSSQFGTNAVINNQGRSSYHGMLLSLQKRFSQGLEFDVNYTYSKSLDNNSTVANTVAGGLVCDILNPGICKGPSDFDIRHLFNANFIYDLPFGRGRVWGSDVNRWVDTSLVDGRYRESLVHDRDCRLVQQRTWVRSPLVSTWLAQLS